MEAGLLRGRVRLGKDAASFEGCGEEDEPDDGEGSFESDLGEEGLEPGGGWAAGNGGLNGVSSVERTRRRVERVGLPAGRNRAAAASLGSMEHRGV